MKMVEGTCQTVDVFQRIPFNLPFFAGLDVVVVFRLGTDAPSVQVDDGLCLQSFGSEAKQAEQAERTLNDRRN